jgi:hypothetical protein
MDSAKAAMLKATDAVCASQKISPTLEPNSGPRLLPHAPPLSGFSV